ncbi:fibronectin type III domain-containing protein [Sulfurimonas sediminis]|uniref:Fibronectin type III domain-containing protein n=1 Tax=Sulfurimonas sediminis TaxID=2590020 RepID=A0A7M1B5L4_9BACT|nr:fibronectin type III domain-containing protein [Sulfurimonas sediminis]QOP43982.1 fibronectin type III domain-containing protein [Sulfurimonas sediminis]
MKLLSLSTLCAVSLLILSGCQGISPLPKKKVAIDSTLPVVTLTKNGIMRDMKTVAFEWKSIKDPRVNGIYVYKRILGKKTTKELDYYDRIDNRFKTHYLDAKNKPGTKYSYAFRVVSKDAQGQLSKVYNVSTLPVLESVAWIHSIAGLPRSAKIIWRPHENQRVASYIIERQSVEDESFKKIATLKGRLNAEYIDEDLKDNAVYLYRIRAKTYDGIISQPSQIVKSVTKALPKSVEHISASKNLPKMIKISWSVSKQKDFHQYYLYRGEDIDSSFELIAKLYNNSFTDHINKDGQVYFYRVSVVDKDGLESEHDENTVMGMTLPKPDAPVVTSIQLTDSGVELSWKATDARIKSYKIVRKRQIGWFKETTKEYKNIHTNRFLDTNITADSIYTYTVYGIDENGIVSKPSTEVKIKVGAFTKVVDGEKSAPVKEVHVKTYIKNTDSTQERVTPVKDLDLNEI